MCILLIDGIVHLSSSTIQQSDAKGNDPMFIQALLDCSYSFDLSSNNGKKIGKFNHTYGTSNLKFD